MNPVQNTAKTTQDIAQKIARQIAQEPLEIFKDARDQIARPETSGQPDNQTARQPEDQQQKLAEQQKIQDNLKAQRRMEAFQRELEDIRKQDLFKSLQEKISQGIVIPLEDYPDLSMEQKQVLKAQMEAVRNQMAKQQAVGQNSLEIPVSKKSRRFGTTQKQEAQKQTTHVEKPVPPSG
jgi:cell fate (sporulation/competence/biofilm development) regulator YlbF (YheA/YmcA/DUF963 family)